MEGKFPGCLMEITSFSLKRDTKKECMFIAWDVGMWKCNDESDSGILQTLDGITESLKMSFPKLK